MSMKALIDFFKKKRTFGGRSLSWSDSGRGIEYNKINDTRKVSKRIYSADIARNPRVVAYGANGNEFIFKDVQKRKAKVAGKDALVHYKHSKVHGRGSL